MTGAGGHLGANLVPVLAAAGHHVRALDLACPAWLDAECGAVDVLDTGALAIALAGCEVVVHLAAVISVAGDPTGRVWRTNVAGSRSLVTAAARAGVRRIVHMSSIHAFDVAACPAGVHEGSPPAAGRDLPVYDRSKAEGERRVREGAATHGVEAVVLNPTGVIGPNDHAPSRMGRLFLALRDGRLRGLTTGAFDWVDARDVAAATAAAATAASPGARYILAGHVATIAALARLAAEVTGAPVPRPVVPLPLLRPVGPVATWLARRRGEGLLPTQEALRALRHPPQVTSTAARDGLGHRPRPLRQTVADVYEWFARTGR